MSRAHLSRRPTQPQDAAEAGAVRPVATVVINIVGGVVEVLAADHEHVNVVLVDYDDRDTTQRDPEGTRARIIRYEPLEAADLVRKFDALAEEPVKLDVLAQQRGRQSRSGGQ